MASVSPSQSDCYQCGRKLQPSNLFCPGCGSPRGKNDEEDPLIGALIGNRYLIKKPLGTGKNGTIYEAEHTALRRKVTVKVLSEASAEDDLAVERFRREATSISDMDSDHIARILDFGRTPAGQLYLAMEWLDGESLQAKILSKNAMPIADAVAIVAQICSAMVEPHAVGLIHRDLRPQNIFVVKKGKESNFVKIVGFGLAKLVQSDGVAATTQLGLTMEEPAYISPELAKGKPTDRRSDIYSIGCIAYELLTGQKPFLADEPFEVIRMHVEETPKEIQSHRLEVSAELAEVVTKAMEKETANRYATASQFKEALEAVEVLEAFSGAKNGEQAGEQAAEEIVDHPHAEENTVKMSSPPTGEESSEKEKTFDSATTTKLFRRGVSSSGKIDKNRETQISFGVQKSAVLVDKTADSAMDSMTDATSDEDPRSLSGAWYADSLALTKEDGEISAGHQRSLDRARSQSFHIDELKRKSTAAEKIVEPEPVGSQQDDASFDDDFLYYDPRKEAKRNKKIALALLGLVVILVVGIWFALSPESPEAQSDTTIVSQSQQPDMAEQNGANSGGDLGYKKTTSTAVDPKIPKAAVGSTQRNNRKAKQARATKQKKQSRRPATKVAKQTAPSITKSKKVVVASVSEEDKQKAQFYVGLGFAALRNGGTSKAMEHFNRALGMNPSNWDAKVGKGEALLLQNKAKSATGLLAPAVKSKPKNIKALILLGEAYLASGKTKSAAAQFRKALQMQPTSKRARQGYLKATGEGYDILE